uniref:UPAR/Ly6 domain-containing protein n=1 Tax=Leptobrachium leishanense TaxID=445787 RepID=A0A8C5QX63_9ANUR
MREAKKILYAPLSSGHALECYSCEYGTCMVQLKENCGILEVCATETAKVKKGCMNPLNCLTDSSVTFAGATMTSSPSCCYSSLCNAAAVPKVSVMSGMAAMFALWVSRWF